MTAIKLIFALAAYIYICKSAVAGLKASVNADKNHHDHGIVNNADSTFSINRAAGRNITGEIPHEHQFTSNVQTYRPLDEEHRRIQQEQLAAYRL
jgi:hypothetical protein